MPVETTWYIEKRVLYQRFYGDVTLADFDESVRQVGIFMAAGTPLVHAIADLTDVAKWPPLLQMSKTARRSPYPELGWTAIITENPVLRFIASMLIQMTKGSFKIVRTQDEAVRFLLDRDNTLVPPVRSTRS